jgi:hypothetical protein
MIRSGFLVRVALVCLAASGVGLPALRTGASTPRALDAPAGLLLGSEPEPDAGPLPPGTPPQPPPIRFRDGGSELWDPVQELQQISERSEAAARCWGRSPRTRRAIAC